MNCNKDVEYMQMALDYAKKAAANDDVPVGAVIVCDDTGEVVAVGYNTKEKDGLVTGHAEINAIQSANATRKNWRLSNCTMYVTLEPCPMCAGAIMAARIPRVVCGTKDAVAGAMGSVWALHEHPTRESLITVEFGCMEEASQTLLRDFFGKKRGSQ